MHTNYIQLPPDSTGKQIHVQRILLITVDNSSLLRKGNVITSNLSNNSLKICEVVTLGATHMIHAMFTSTAAETLTDVSIGETLSVNGVMKATVISPAPHYQFFNISGVVSSDNPYHGQIVDAHGSAQITLSDGTPTVDASSKLRISLGHPIGTYDFIADSQDSLFWDKQVGAGAITYVPNESSMVLSTTTASGDASSRSTVRYHYFQPGTGIFSSISIAHGDLGKVGNKRHWGLGDSNNGLSWGLYGTELGVDIYSDASGAPTQNREIQSNWNVDKLDGTGISRLTLDITKTNMYWVDYLWPVGAVRFGIFSDAGQRIVAHIFHNVNSGVLPFTSTSALPVSVRNENTALTSSGSQLRYISSAVYSDGSLDYVVWRYSDMENASMKTVSTNTPLLSVRSVLTLNGKSNRVNVYPEKASIFVTGGAIKLDYYVGIVNASMTGATWSIVGSSTLQGDEACSTVTTLSATDGSKMLTFYANVGVTEFDMAKHYETNDIGISVSGDGTEQLAYCFIATALTATPTQARMTLGYRELS
jgi:hypothetical protein